jgi:hypothetical protein
MQNPEQLTNTLNLIGYGLAKFDLAFAREFGFNTKAAFYKHIVGLGLATSIKAVANQQESFDPYFDNGRKGWWQRNQREHIKIFIDSLFGSEDVIDFANVVKLHILEENPGIKMEANKITPIIKSKFKQLNETGNEAEYYFLQNFRTIDLFKSGIIEDARLWGDGYDFQIQLKNHFVVAEVKGVREAKGPIRMTDKEFEQASSCLETYFLIVVSNLNRLPKITTIQNPVKSISFTKKDTPTIQTSFHTGAIKW